MKFKEDKIKLAIVAAKKVIKKEGRKNNSRVPQIIPIPKKIGGVLPLIPIFTVKAVNAINTAKQQLHENKRHNKALQNIQVGKGAYVELYRECLELYLSKN